MCAEAQRLNASDRGRRDLSDTGLQDVNGTAAGTAGAANAHYGQVWNAVPVEITHSNGFRPVIVKGAVGVLRFGWQVDRVTSCKSSVADAQKDRDGVVVVVGDGQVRNSILVEVTNCNGVRSVTHGSCSRWLKGSIAVAQQDKYRGVVKAGYRQVQNTVSGEVTHRDRIVISTYSDRASRRWTKGSVAVAQQDRDGGAVAKRCIVGYGQVWNAVPVEVTHGNEIGIKARCRTVTRFREGSVTVAKQDGDRARGLRSEEHTSELQS